ncbi:hypothetical protein ILUMI_04862 [Ignelater luminosus]|uniref:Major facilitator superfamily (MFS) profile domain-containing protein n=1 Tax=Ignelater luminosus TaxID=2038154 RepID=A0A8K0GIM9_IGNLU|nr:hypothetical protein ILUMI_04862 [Ignelater luminosus]
MKKLCFKNVYQYVATLSGSLALVACGINLGWTSPYLPQILNGTITEISMTSDEGSWCAVMPLIGAPLGAFLAAIFVDRIGRKYTALAMAPVTSSMFLLLGFTRSTILICLARLIIGSVGGGLYTTLPMYYGEIADPSVRGILTATVAIGIIIGKLIINVLGIYYSILVTSLISCSIPIIHFALFILMPESPYYFIKKGRYEEAKKSLQKLRSSSDVEQELKSLKEAVSRQENDTKGKITDIFTVTSVRRAMIIFIILNLTKKYSGKDPFLFYTTTIFQTAEGSVDPNLSVIIYIAVEIFATTSALFFIDRIGRKPIIIFSAIGCTITLACTGLYFFLKENNSSYIKELGWLPITTLVIYNICYSLGLELAPTIYLGELFPTNIKATALGLGDSFSAVNGAIAVKVFQLLVDFEGMFMSFWIFSGCCSIGLIFIIKYVPETKNKTLEEIQLYLIKKSAKTNS